MNNIARIREEKGLTQKDLSNALKEVDKRIDVGMVSRFEQGLCLPTKDVLESLERLLQVDRSEFYPDIDKLFGSEQKFVKNENQELVLEMIMLGYRLAKMGVEL